MTLELLELLAEFLESVPNKKFEKELQNSSFLKQLEPLIAFIPEEYKKQAKSLKFSELQKFIKAKNPEKARIIEKHKKWSVLENQFREFKKKI